jgi:hypothetical protein
MGDGAALDRLMFDPFRFSEAVRASSDDCPLQAAGQHIFHQHGSFVEPHPSLLSLPILFLILSRRTCVALFRHRCLPDTAPHVCPYSR